MFHFSSQLLKTSLLQRLRLRLSCFHIDINSFLNLTSCGSTQSVNHVNFESRLGGCPRGGTRVLLENSDSDSFIMTHALDEGPAGQIENQVLI
jgi:hypothetical protein